jgi:hypothetical protein
VSFLAPENFEETIVRIYARDPKHVSYQQVSMILLQYTDSQLGKSHSRGVSSINARL